MSEVNFDLELLANNSLFQKIKEQSNLIEDLFHGLANDFPQSELLQLYANSKGTKISKGYNLENAPYQVLDLIRDFDRESGFNIRVLNWWGHGLYIFVYFGRFTYEKNFLSNISLLDTYRDCNHPSPWAYGQIISKQETDLAKDSLNNPEKIDFSQIFKRLEIDQDFSKTHSMIKKEIRFILDNHY
jgi:hypothetical protein